MAGMRKAQRPSWVFWWTSISTMRSALWLYIKRDSQTFPAQGLVQLSPHSSLLLLDC